MHTDSKNHNTPTDANNVLVAGVYNKYKVVVRRNYYGEIQEEERIIEGETFERAKFEFNNTSLFGGLFTLAANVLPLAVSGGECVFYITNGAISRFALQNVQI